MNYHTRLCRTGEDSWIYDSEAWEYAPSPVMVDMPDGRKAKIEVEILQSLPIDVRDAIRDKMLVQAAMMLKDLG